MGKFLQQRLSPFIFATHWHLFKEIEKQTHSEIIQLIPDR